MKNLFPLSFVLLFGTSLNSQTLTPGNSTIVPGGGTDKTKAAPTDRTSVAPPEDVKTQFEADNPSTSEVKWKVEGNKYWVSYTDPKTKMGHIIVYDKDGKVIHRESETDNLTYPSAISDYYKQKYPDEKFRVWKTEREPGKTYYYITRKGKNIWFDQEGKIVPESK
jgi:hypothetical protein